MHTHTPDADPKDRPELFLKKVEQCRYIFDFTDPMSDLKAKEVKRSALNEILDHVTASTGQLTPPAYPALIKMVS